MASSSSLSLSDVPEESVLEKKKKEGPRKPSSPYLSSSAAASASTFAESGSGSVRSAAKATSTRTLGKSSNDQLGASSASMPAGTVKRTTSASSSTTTQSTTTTGKPLKNSSNVSQVSSSSTATTQKYRVNPRLHHDKDAEPAPCTIMHWSRAPVWGALPMRVMRGHTVTLVDTMAWLIGGCDEKDSSKDLYCFNTGMLVFFLML